MKKFSGFLNKRNSQVVEPSTTSSSAAASPSGDGTNASAAVKRFCESGGNPRGSNNTQPQGEEVLHLPVIVEACEASPEACAATAQQIRKYLKNGFTKPYTQYNSLMLLRILCDNPGATFTRNLDSKFVGNMSTLLRQSQDPSVQQIARETLIALQRDRHSDSNLKPLLDMWKQEQQATRPNRRGYPQYPQSLQSFNAYNAINGSRQQGSSSRHRAGQALPPAHELAGRIEEAKTSAKILIQLTQSTPPHEFAKNDLIPEFADRCLAAQRSMQVYMNANPPPDEATLQTLIEVCEQISLAQSKHQRALLAARRSIGQLSPIPSEEAEPPASNTVQSPLPTIPALVPQRPIDPFADENSVPEPLNPSKKQATTLDAAYNYGRTPHPNPNTHELAADANAYSATSNGVHQTPPQTAQRALDGDDEDDLYAVSPVTNKKKAAVSAVPDPATVDAQQPEQPMRSSIFASGAQKPMPPPSRKPMDGASSPVEQQLGQLNLNSPHAS